MTRLFQHTLTILSLATFAAVSQASVITTSFAISDGFTTGGMGNVTLSDGAFTVTFGGGQQQQFFDGPSYNQGPDAYIFLNGTLNTATGSSDTGLIDFNQGVDDVSFFAANRGNGAGVTLNVFGIDDTTLLGTTLVTQTSNAAASNPALTRFQASDFGGQRIGSIGVDLPGPAGNPPYALAIDTFSATSVPEPTSFASLTLIGTCVLLRRKRKQS